MGGSVFNAEGLATPRMPPTVYYSVLDHAEALLKACFKLVGHAIEAPAKTSHGDIDIMVAEPVDRSLTAAGRRTGPLLAESLGADKWKKMGGGSTYHLALRWPKEFEDQLISVDEVRKCPCDDETGLAEVDDALSEEREQKRTGLQADASSTSTAGYPSSSSPIRIQKHIQVDVSIMPTPAFFHWNIFFQAHGDLWQMLGGILRRLGITPTSRGLFLRIAEVEMHNKEQSRVLMSNDPNAVLDYMGLDRERYWRMFETWEEMMDYVASCRFHDPGRWKHPTKHDAEAEEDEEVKEGRDQRSDLLKSNDRRRATKRPLFMYWIKTYLPAHVDEAPGKSALLTRDQVIEDAKEFFGDEFANRFEARKAKVVRQIKVDKLWADIRKGLPVQGTEIGDVMKGMKREIVGNREARAVELEKLEGLEEIRVAYEADRFDEVLKWAMLNWNEVGQRQKRLNREKSRVPVLEKGSS
ncbi:hypothetical protein AYO21_08974 [Fonsecaea monophora]|uniref:Uncharacterized protein n=1 Tax=Fonsecaea monophora TaxID=254056 RepID=A0A177EZM6_9EURO|nr:hypothetical protein AYO21_08974 [Fonsecaea monophora]KAH0842682.1 hypothetical protein FOPE_07434 [Fonsecaea pedrosoi]OAG36801.1 hypothetical protein AYO21_08974 [Fonsecaea monophora]